MRFIHTADWHLGRYFHGMHLTADQREIIMGQLVPLVQEEKVDAVVIAGDIYDRGVPPVEAVDLFDEFLMKMAEMHIKVFYIAGNHDSESRLNFGSQLMRASGIFARGRLDERWLRLSLKMTSARLPFTSIRIWSQLRCERLLAWRKPWTLSRHMSW